MNVMEFNHPIGDWDVSCVTDMWYMFFYLRAFNQAVGDWDVSGVTYMCDEVTLNLVQQ